jgi:hypothetical protein
MICYASVAARGVTWIHRKMISLPPLWLSVTYNELAQPYTKIYICIVSLSVKWEWCGHGKSTKCKHYMGI